ncbi:hypothetical protein AC45_5069 [Escherichia coli 2-210-07_S3_C3]|nr:hypothetical protein AC45_5069 [Escherichia coli 2-210-07_S3_C3]
MLANHLADKFFEKHINTNIDIKRLQNDVESYILRANAIREK